MCPMGAGAGAGAGAGGGGGAAAAAAAAAWLGWGAGGGVQQQESLYGKGSQAACHPLFERQVHEANAAGFLLT